MTPMTSITLNTQPVAEIRGRVIVEVLDAVESLRAGRTLGECLQAERLVGKQEAEKGPLVLSEPAEQPHQNRDDRWVQWVETRGALGQRRDRGRCAIPAQVDGLSHGCFGLRLQTSRAALKGDVQRGNNKMRDLIERLVENEFLESPSDFLPLLLAGLRKLIRVGTEALVQKADDEQRLLAASRGCFGQLLQEENVLAFGVQGRELKELPKLIQDDEKSFRLLFRDQLGVRIQHQLHGIGIGQRRGRGTEATLDAVENTASGSPQVFQRPAQSPDDHHGQWLARARDEDRKETRSVAFEAGQVNRATQLRRNVGIPSSEQMGQEEGETGFAGTVVTGDTPGALARIPFEAAADAIQTCLDMPRGDIALQRSRIVEITLQMGRPQEPPLDIEKLGNFHFSAAKPQKGAKRHRR